LKRTRLPAILRILARHRMSESRGAIV
jgi:hypothetical protein